MNIYVHDLRLKTLLILFYGMTWLTQGDTIRSKRIKRDVFQLCQIVNHYTHRTCLSYFQYGCYCGFGGSGVAMDDTDRCCKVHDDCYRNLDCFSAKLQRYNYKCSNNTCVCLSESGCARKVCDCDTNFGRCLQNVTFNPIYLKYNFTFCLKPWLIPKVTTTPSVTTVASLAVGFAPCITTSVLSVIVSVSTIVGCVVCRRRLRAPSTVYQLVPSHHQ